MNWNKILLFACFLLPVVTFAQNEAEPGNESMFQKVEVEASFPGNANAWRDFLVKNLNGNAPVDNNAPAGKYTVIVQFIVKKDGTVSGIEAKTNFGYGMEKEVLRIIGKSGLWNPARQNGRAVNAYRKQPVTFVVEQDDDCTLTSNDPYTLFANSDNEIAVRVKKMKSDQLDVTVSRGTITDLGDGKYNIRLTGTDRVLIKVYNKKNNKELGAWSYEVAVKK